MHGDHLKEIFAGADCSGQAQPEHDPNVNTLVCVVQPNDGLPRAAILLVHFLVSLKLPRPLVNEQWDSCEYGVLSYEYT